MVEFKIAALPRSRRVLRTLFLMCQFSEWLWKRLKVFMYGLSSVNLPRQISRTKSSHSVFGFWFIS